MKELRCLYIGLYAQSLFYAYLLHPPSLFREASVDNPGNFTSQGLSLQSNFFTLNSRNQGHRNAIFILHFYTLKK